MKALAAAVLIVSCCAAHAQPVGVTIPQSGVLATPNGSFVLGSVETGSSGTSTKDMFLLDTKTGQVWFRGCISWDASEKCKLVGFRPYLVGDGAGGPVYESVGAAAQGRQAQESAEELVKGLWGNRDAKKK